MLDALKERALQKTYGPLNFCCWEFFAKVAELVDALALGASGASRESSSLSFRTRYFIKVLVEESGLLSQLDKACACRFQ